MIAAAPPGSNPPIPLAVSTEQSWRHVIVNADDLGQTEGINRGVAAAVECGIVTSASLMVRWPASPAAVTWASTSPSISLGLHIDLAEWSYRGGQWLPLYEVVRDDDADAVSDELSRQLGMFLRLVGRPPTHLDAHQHLHLRDPLRTQVLAAGDRLRVPVRGLSAKVAYCGGFYGQSGTGEPIPGAITFEGLLAVLDELGPGTTELSCHPGLAPLNLDTMYLTERPNEVATLCDPRLPAALAQRRLTLCSFSTSDREGSRSTAAGAR